ncbi:MAG: hypothetical protein GXP62_03455 [Oligoflexia bacterium]|nr:hypothetical protein [Oligoflexia bacterium]
MSTSASPTASLRAAWRFVHGVSKGLSLGVFFPPASRLPDGLAPGGSDQEWVFSPRRRQISGGLVRSRHRLAIPHLTEPVRVLQLTDVHLTGPVPWLDPLCAAIAASAADLVLLTGDIVTRGWQPDTVDRFLDALPPAPLGRFAVMGNWEHWSGASPQRWAKLLSRHGITLLTDQVVHAGPIQLGGTDDLLAGSPDLGRLRTCLRQREPTLVMSHSPAAFPALAGPDIHLVLSGHSHGGQVRIPGLGAVWVPRGSGAFVSGWYQQDKTWLFVSRGLGYSIAPVRFACPAELAEITLTRP